MAYELGKQKRFILFTFDMYYPAGGMDDCRGSYDTLDAALKASKEPGNTGTYTQVLDIVEGLVVYDN
jgi:hypothetical protein